jgi:AraC-like DNA-binding protein
MTPRTLQRRLKAHGISYQKLLENLRKDLAKSYLRERRLAIGELAYLLGYSEPSAFQRAFKRWTGMTPDNFRRHET